MDQIPRLLMILVLLLLLAISCNALHTVVDFHQDSAVQIRADSFGGYGVFASTDLQEGDTLLTLRKDHIPTGVIPGSDLDVRVVQRLLDSNNESPTSTVAAVESIYSIASALVAWKVLRHNDATFSLTRNIQKILSDGVGHAVNTSAPELPWENIEWQIPLCWSDATLDAALIYGADTPTSADDSTATLEACLEAKRRTKNLRQNADRIADSFANFMLDDDDDAKQSPAPSSGPYPQRNKQPCLKKFSRQAVALVVSRMFTLRGDQVVLLPLVDCINHSGTPNARLVDEEDISVVASTSIPNNAEIYISYGSQEPAIGFASYGFVDDSGTKNGVQTALATALVYGQTNTKKYSSNNVNGGNSSNESAEE